MFCPNCGAAEQAKESFCRSCGIFLPDLSKLEPREDPISQNIRVNSFFAFATALISFTLATLLYATVIGPGTPFIITVVAAFLVVMFIWQSIAFVRTLKLKRQVKKLVPKRETEFEELNTGPDSAKASRVAGCVECRSVRHKARSCSRTSSRLAKAEYQAYRTIGDRTFRVCLPGTMRS